MRPIKFRAWDGSKMYLPEQSDNDDFMLDCEGSVVHTREVGYERHMQIFRRTGWVLMQYTGLKDKNGNEIYEGDVVRYSPWNTADGFSPMGIDGWKKGDVYFHKGRFVVRGNEIWDTLSYTNIEVIGNIYEHPELIPHQ